MLPYWTPETIEYDNVLQGLKMPAYLKINDDIHWMRNEIFVHECSNLILGYSVDIYRSRVSDEEGISSYPPLGKYLDESVILNKDYIDITSYDGYYPHSYRPTSVWAENDKVDLLVYEAGKLMWGIRDKRLRQCLTR